jgi:hypothetical protein
MPDSPAPQKSAGNSALVATRVARVKEALRLTEDWALRMAVGIPAIPDLDQSLLRASREINAIRQDLAWARRQDGIDRVALERQLTLAACNVIDALSVVVKKPEQKGKKC